MPRAAITTPTKAGPIVVRPEFRAIPAIHEDRAIPLLNDATAKAAASVGAEGAYRDGQAGRDRRDGHPRDAQ